MPITANEPIIQEPVFLRYADDIDEVKSFCIQQNIIGDMAEAVRLVAESFPSLNRLVLSIEEDYESDDKWIVANVTVQEKPEQAVEQYRKCIQLWVREIPWPAIGLIRLSFQFE